MGTTSRSEERKVGARVQDGAAGGVRGGESGRERERRRKAKTERWRGGTGR